MNAKSFMQCKVLYCAWPCYVSGPPPPAAANRCSENNMEEMPLLVSSALEVRRRGCLYSTVWHHKKLSVLHPSSDSTDEHILLSFLANHLLSPNHMGQASLSNYPPVPPQYDWMVQTHSHLDLTMRTGTVCWETVLSQMWARSRWNNPNHYSAITSNHS